MRLVDRRGISNAALHHRTECRAEVVKNPPLSVRATVRSRRWYMDQLEREVTMQTASLKLYLTEARREPDTFNRAHPVDTQPYQIRYGVIEVTIAGQFDWNLL